MPQSGDHDQEPTPRLFGAEHVRRYVETHGNVAHIWNGVPILLLTTTGRPLAATQATAPIYGRDRDSYLVVASPGGAAQHPSWYLNLLQTPRGEIQVRAEHIPVDARTAGWEEQDRLWRAMTSIWPAYDHYQAKTSREIPVVGLDTR